jgi:hypothetical protein
VDKRTAKVKILMQVAARYAAVGVTCLLPMSDSVRAEDNVDAGQFFVQTSVFTHHFFPSPVHENHNRLINVEWQAKSNTILDADRSILGLALFRNSFGQPSQYLYLGQKWDVHKNIYLKLTAGLLHGYKDPYQNKIPLNHYGTAPVIVPSIGLRFKQVTLETIFLSNRAVMIGLGYEF